MKILAISLLAALSLGAGQALASTHHRAAASTLRVVMGDPGCHWFLVGGKNVTTTSVRGPVRVLNQDEATLKVANRHGIRTIPVGTSLVLGRGSYVVMMKGQAVDDNYLKLTVK